MNNLAKAASILSLSFALLACAPMLAQQKVKHLTGNPHYAAVDRMAVSQVS